MVEGSPGRMASDEMESDDRKSFEACQVVPLSVVFQIPPPSVAAHIVFVEVGWIRRSLTRPTECS